MIAALPLALLLAMQAPLIPPAEALRFPPGNWEHVSWEGPITVYYDPGSVHPVEDRLSVRILAIGEFEPAGARMGLLTAELHCANNTGMPIAVDFYDAEGRQTGERRTPPAARRAVPTAPNTPDDAVQRLVCGAAPRAPE